MKELSYKVGFVYKERLIRKIGFSKGEQSIIVIGRKEPCDVVVPDTQISSQHAQLIHNENNELFILDLESTNGTFVNERKIESGVPYPISRRDKIQLSKNGVISFNFQPDEYESVNRVDQVGSTFSESGSVLGTTNILEKVHQKGKLVLGRSSECDVQLPDQISISRRHAILEKKGNDIYITDLDSLNGTYLNGRRIVKSEKVKDDDIVFIGRYQIKLVGRARDLSLEVAIKAENVSKRFSNGKYGLHECSFEIPSKSLTAVMGPSGCGKSTLLKALNGDSPVSGGRVLISGLDLAENYDYLKTQIGYVPQDDIVHRELTVEQSLFFASKLRLDHADDNFIDQKVDEVLKYLNISHVKNNLVGAISGGQRKRVSIAVELLTDPMILFLDEPTSPLDPQTIEEFLNILQSLAKKGTAVIMVTHKPEDLNYMDDVIFMAEGGYLVHQGDARRYLDFFKVENTIKVYSELAQPKAKKWIESRPENELSAKPFVSGFQKKSSVNFFSQLFWLTARYAQIKLNDKANVGWMIGQAVIIAGILCIVFEEITQAVLFLMSVAAVWFGANNAAREIVGELPIYKRERMFNQGIIAYILSKLIVLSMFAAVQCLIFTSIVYISYDGTNPSMHNAPLMFMWMFCLSISSTLMGLLLSAISSTTEKVMTLIPIALIPQILLAGSISKIPTVFVEILSYLTITRWGTEGFANIQEKISAPTFDFASQINQVEGGEIKSGENSELISNSHVVDAVPELKNSFHKSYYDDHFPDLAGKFELDAAAVFVIGFAFFLGIFISLKRKDPIKMN